MLYLLRKYEGESQRELARKLLAFGMKKEYGREELPRMEYSPQGKPFFPDESGIYFNYSHSRQGILCGIHSSEIGVDIERIISYKERLGAKVCHPAERKLLAEAASRDELITRIWTCKESYLKYLGCGIRSDLRLLDCSGCTGDRFEMEGCNIYARLEADFGMAACCRGPLPNIVEVRQEELQ